MSTILPSDPSTESTTQPSNPIITTPKQPRAPRKVVFLSILVGIIAALGSSFLVHSILNGSFESVESKVQTTVQQVRDHQELPRQVDSVTSWTGIEAEGDAIRYNYALSSSVDASALSADTIRSSVLPGLCSTNSTKDILDAGMKMKYAYTFEGTTKILDFTVTKEDCVTL